VLCYPGKPTVFATATFPAAAVDENDQGRILRRIGKIKVEEERNAPGLGEWNSSLLGNLSRVSLTHAHQEEGAP
jgi:hypothetical protein